MHPPTGLVRGKELHLSTTFRKANAQSSKPPSGSMLRLSAGSGLKMKKPGSKIMHIKVYGVSVNLYVFFIL